MLIHEFIFILIFHEILTLVLQFQGHIRARACALVGTMKCKVSAGALLKYYSNSSGSPHTMPCMSLVASYICSARADDVISMNIIIGCPQIIAFCGIERCGRRPPPRAPTCTYSIQYTYTHDVYQPQQISDQTSFKFGEGFRTRGRAMGSAVALIVLMSWFYATECEFCRY